MRILPYECLNQLYEDYYLDCIERKLSKESIPSIKTFGRAFAELEEFKLLGCKGSFTTCELCNNAHALLRSLAKFLIREFRAMILRVKALHLSIQFAERYALETSRRNCLTLYDMNRNPTCVYICIGNLLFLFFLSLSLYIYIYMNI